MNTNRDRARADSESATQFKFYYDADTGMAVSNRLSVGCVVHCGGLSEDSDSKALRAAQPRPPARRDSLRVTD